MLYITSSSEKSNGIRTILTRCWDESKNTLHIVMYFPSTADYKNDDMTIQRCCKIANTNGYGSVNVYNICNIQHCGVNLSGKDVVLAYGNKVDKERSKDIFKNFQDMNCIIYCFNKLRNGNPGLPTRIPNNTKISIY
jgi:hypothetical protein